MASILNSIFNCMLRSPSTPMISLCVTMTEELLEGKCPNYPKKDILGPLNISNSVVEPYLGIDAERRLTTNNSRTTNDDLKESC